MKISHLLFRFAKGSR